MSMKLFIPALGTRLLLTADWDFLLYNERRNATLMTLLGDKREISYTPAPERFALPAGTELILDRYYIKQNMGDFDSVTFRIAGVSAASKTYSWSTEVRRRQVRFWVKLDDANKLQIEVLPPKEKK